MKSSNVAWASYFNFNDNGLNSTLSDFPNSLAEYKSVLGGSGGSSSAAPPPAPTTTTAPPPPATTTTAPAPTTTTTAPAPAPATTTTTTTPMPDTTTTTTPPPRTTPTTVPTGTTTTVPTTTVPTTSPAPPPPPASSGPPPGSITVTTLDVGAGSATVGDESSMKFTVTVTPAVNETVGVYGDAGLFKLCSVTITTDKGSGTCSMTDSELAPGLYLAGAITLSGTDYVGSFSNLVPFAIAMPS